MKTASVLPSIGASAFVLSLAACSTGTVEASGTGGHGPVQAQDLREEVIGQYLSVLSETDDPVAAEEAVMEHFSDDYAEHRTERIEQYGASMRESNAFFERHPDFTDEDLDFEHAETGAVVSWEATLECGSEYGHATAFYIEVDQDEAGEPEVVNFSHAQGCDCMSCLGLTA